MKVHVTLLLPRIGADRGDHFPQADFPGLIRQGKPDGFGQADDPGLRSIGLPGGVIDD